MSNAELIIRLTVITLGSLLMVLGVVFAYRDPQQGCLPFLLAIVGMLMIGTGFPSAEVFQ